MCAGRCDRPQPDGNARGDSEASGVPIPGDHADPLLNGQREGATAMIEAWRVRILVASFVLANVAVIGLPLVTPSEGGAEFVRSLKLLCGLPQ